MTSTAQLEANRSNALRSTGPRTEAGKARSASNALTHGLTSRLGVAIDRGPFAEDPTDVEFFISEVVRGLEPQGAQEWAEAVHIGSVYVRLQRLLRLESAAITASTRLTVTEVLDPLAHLDDTTSAERTACRALDSSLLDRLPRYESHLSRELDRSLARYRQLQAMKCAA